MGRLACQSSNRLSSWCWFLRRPRKRIALPGISSRARVFQRQLMLRILLRSMGNTASTNR